ncbi:MAG: hypothetical protein A3G27_09545 [Betaproteobacteria bacterium RIFCSPLOWO2_12_FULL_66_14]|nr:MAG: hypothetical protein A3G27_09545 [Betaproteobacteria bacterium RIFCSPLOWO2_12_FULL_66_14]
MTWRKHCLQMIEQLPIGAAVVLPDGMIEYANPCLAQLLGLSSSRLAGSALTEFAPAARALLGRQIKESLLVGQSWHGETELRMASGETCHLLEWVHARRDAAGEIAHFVHFFQDMSALRRTEALHQLAFYDALTRLPNRNLLNDRLARTMVAAQRNRSGFALLYIDVDHFKRVNDTLGHEAGDELLRQLAARLVRSLRRTDTVARWGGDEFVAVIEQVADAGLATRVVEKLLAACSGDYELAGKLSKVTLSIGISLYPRDAEEASTLIRCADMAMYQAKAAGRSGYHVVEEPAASYWRAA